MLSFYSSEVFQCWYYFLGKVFRLICVNKTSLRVNRLIHRNNNNDRTLIAPKVTNKPVIDSMVIALNVVDEREQ